MTAAAAWLLLRWMGRCAGPIEKLLGWGLACLLIVAASGEVLGWGGVLGAAGFFWSHALLLLALAWVRRNELAGDFTAWRDLGRDVGGQFRLGDAPAWMGAGLLVLCLGLVGLAALGKPVVYDALTYRFSRIGLWLQDGCIRPFATDDARLNYMPVAPDLVMAWLLGAHGAGFQWAALAQTFGGGLLLGATAGLARLTGLSRGGALGAAVLPLGMANVIPQFTSAYTDLFTAGVFAAAFYLWLVALQRGEGSRLAGAGVALALGSKGTMLYLAPGALCWVLVCGWRHPAPWRAWRVTALAGLLASLLLVIPGLSRNARTYGSLFGPAESIQQQHGGSLTFSEHGQKLGLNLVATLAQLFEPNAQPPGWRTVAPAWAEALAVRLPRADKFSFDGLDRRGNLEKVLQLPEPDADVASCGVLCVALLVAGWIGAGLRRRQSGADLVLAWGGGVGLFVLCLYTLLQWHPYSFRFWILVAPWMAVVGAWGLELLPRRLRQVSWGIVTLCTLGTCWNVIGHTYQAGWPAVIRPERGLSYTVFGQVRHWTLSLAPADEALHVALPVNQPLAAFLRTGAPRTVELQKLSALSPQAESAVKDFAGWLVVPARHFAGREGRVEKLLWLFGGDENSPFSLAAYRRVPPPH